MAQGHRHLVLVASKPQARGPVDVQVQRAIALLRGALAERWTVTTLARKVGLSRPAFARRFVQNTGLSPARYLARERMQRAAELLRETPWGLAQIAVRVGYDSEFAFNRAFKRHHHVAPGKFRRMPSITLGASTNQLPQLRAAA